MEMIPLQINVTLKKTGATVVVSIPSLSSSLLNTVLLCEATSIKRSFPAIKTQFYKAGFLLMMIVSLSSTFLFGTPFWIFTRNTGIFLSVHIQNLRSILWDTCKRKLNNLYLEAAFNRQIMLSNQGQHRDFGAPFFPLPRITFAVTNCTYFLKKFSHQGVKLETTYFLKLDSDWLFLRLNVNFSACPSNTKNKLEFRFRFCLTWMNPYQ